MNVEPSSNDDYRDLDSMADLQIANDRLEQTAGHVATVNQIRRDVAITTSGMAYDEIDSLRNEIRDLREIKLHLEQTIADLRSHQLKIPQPIDHTYSIEEFMFALATKLGRTYGWRTDYARATRDTPGCQEVRTEDIQKWQKERRVPEWAYAQIAWLTFSHRLGRSGPEWKQHEVEFLVVLYKTDPKEANASLAHKCTSQFGREITEDAIKGAVYRLGKQGKLPLRRH